MSLEVKNNCGSKGSGKYQPNVLVENEGLSKLKVLANVTYLKRTFDKRTENIAGKGKE